MDLKKMATQILRERELEQLRKQEHDKQAYQEKVLQGIRYAQDTLESNVSCQARYGHKEAFVYRFRGVHVTFLKKAPKDPFVAERLQDLLNAIRARGLGTKVMVAEGTRNHEAGPGDKDIQVCATW